MPAKSSSLARLLQMLRRRGFYQETKVLTKDCQQAVFSYGPPGAHLRRNINQEWWKEMVLKRENAFPLDIPCNLTSRTESTLPNESSSPLQTFNSSVADSCLSSYLSILQSVDRRLPFTVACIAHQVNEGEEYAEEKLVIGSTTTTQLVVQEFCPPMNLTQAMDVWLQTRLAWWKWFSHHPSDFTMSDARTAQDGSSMFHILYEFPWGSEPVETLWNRGDHLLKDMEKSTGLNYLGRYERKTGIPAVIQCEMSTERAMTAFLLDAFVEKVPPLNGSKKSTTKEPRQVLHLHPLLAPYKVALAVSGSRLRELRYTASYLVSQLRAAGVTILNLSNVSDTLEACFARSEQLGIPYTIVMNDSSLENGLLGLRSRDTLLRESISITKMTDTILRYTGATTKS